MRTLHESLSCCTTVMLLVAISSAATAQIQLVESGVDASFRGCAVSSDGTVYVGGTDSVLLRSQDAGQSWERLEVTDSRELDFRDVEVLHNGNVVAMSAGPGTRSRLFLSSDKGQEWQEVHVNHIEAGFFNGCSFWNDGTGFVIGDPINGRLFLLQTTDFGETWNSIDGPPMKDGEYGFAASGTGIVTTEPNSVFIATGAAASRVLRSTDRGKSWSSFDSGIRNGSQGAGIFSIAFAESGKAIAIGGDYLKPDQSERNVAISSDAGMSWTVPSIAMPHKACARFVSEDTVVASGRTGVAISSDSGRSWKSISDLPFYTFVHDQTNGQLVFAGPKGSIAIMPVPTDR